MKCPHCHKNGSRVVDSRPADDGHAIRRRRECENCGFRFTTFERVESTPLLVVKKNGTREVYDRDKVLRGVLRAAEKRPIAMDDIQKLVDKVEAKVRAAGSNEVSSQLIGSYVMELLSKLDGIAYVRFASVYREFKDMNAFVDELQDLMAEQKKQK
ncbi:transcriptional repressor NrdR [Ligilactobacillus sp. WC1T17]|uniref:Transcriptional repressor NrdR n=1 Tax=Ligilactobacillus ruminis TaxID=1623 RepID=A0ABY1A9N6_9LACO|nr:transcriptional repressor NrdR [Ligilactobacillus ruminis]